MMGSAKLYFNKDADFGTLNNRTIAIIGYGNQGRSQALNLRDTIEKESISANVIIGSRADESKKKAEKEGFAVYEIQEACQKADIIFMLLPDEIMPEVFDSTIKSTLKNDNVLVFGSGYCVSYKLLDLPNSVDVIMVAPRMGGKEVRDLFVDGSGFPSLIAVEQDASGKARELVITLSCAIGSGRGESSVSIEVTFMQETISDLLSEQFLSPVISVAMQAKYELDLSCGIPPEAALMELHLSGEWATIYKRMMEIGMVAQLPMHSLASQYGQLSRASELTKNSRGLSYEAIKKFGQEKLDEITSGKFVEEWEKDKKAGYATFKRLFEDAENSPMILEEQKFLKLLGRV